MNRIILVLIATPLFAVSADARLLRPKSNALPRFENPGGDVGLVLAGPDGTFYAAGRFTGLGSGRSRNLVRFNLDGSVDVSYSPADIADGDVHAMAVQTDGSLIIAGHFSVVGGETRRKIARLNRDGSLDTTFDPGEGFTETATGPFIRKMAIQSDGRIVVIGSFSHYDGADSPYLVRIMPDGSHDATLAVRTGFEFDPRRYGSVEALALEPDGGILVGGAMNAYNGEPCGSLIRLNVDGTIDQSFSFYASPSSNIVAIARQADGKIIVGGSIDDAATYGTYNVTRINPDGSEDSSFTRTEDASTDLLQVLPDGKILVGGRFDIHIGSLARLHSDGTRDTTFIGWVQMTDRFLAAAPLLDGSLALIRSDQYGYDTRVFHLDSHGSEDGRFSFEPRIGASVYAVQPYGDGWVVAGPFKSVDGVSRSSIAVIDAEGGLGTDFDATSVFGDFDEVRTLAVQADGKIIAGGFLYGVTGNIVRLNADGSRDESFDPGTGFNNGVMALAIQPDGRIIVGGDFTTLGGTPSRFLARIDAFGNRDSGFDVGTGFDAVVRAVELMEDGRFVVGGMFSTYQGTTQRRVARLNADGSRDSTFHTGSEFALNVEALAIDDGRVLATGRDDFSFSGPYQIVRLAANGSVDAGFSPSVSPVGSSATLERLPDGALVVGTAESPTASALTAVDASGNVDGDFIWLGRHRPVLNTSVYSIAQMNGIIAVAGDWVSLGETCGGGLLLLEPIPAPEVVIDPVPESAVAGTAVTFSVSVASDVPITYQWRCDGVDIAGANSAEYEIASAQLFYSGSYTVVVSNAVGSTESGSALLTAVLPPRADSRLLNLSARALCLTGDERLIPGFVIAGTGTKPMLVRAVGPKLADWGVPGTLPDPRLVLRRRTSVNPLVWTDIAENDNWSESANAADIAAAATRTGAFDLEQGSRDAALLIDLAPGVYGAMSEGVEGGIGVAMVELYDADEGAGTAQLVNISNRGYVGAGTDVMIPGFVVSNEGPKTFLVRAVGPALSAWNLTGLLENPRLTVYRKVPGEEPGQMVDEPILWNDDWGENGDGDYTAQIATQVGAFDLTPGSADAAFVITLPPGIYSAVATGAPEPGTEAPGTGLAMVEVYVVE